MLDDRDYMRSEQSSDPRRGGAGLSATFIIIIICVVAFLAQEFTNGFQFLGCNIETSQGTRGLAFTLFRGLETTSPTPFFWQVVGTVSYIFMHATSSHLFWNMFGTYMFGGFLERIIGKSQYTVLYIGSGIIAGIIWLIFTPDGGALVGASGALFGLIVAAAMITPDLKVLLFFVIPMKLKWFATGYLLLTIFWLGGDSQISHLGHLGGAIGGIIITLMFHRDKIRWFPFSSLFKSSAGRKKVYSHGYKKPDLHVVDSDPVDYAVIDKILDKIGKHGMKSLTAEELKLLERAKGDREKKRSR